MSILDHIYDLNNRYMLEIHLKRFACESPGFHQKKLCMSGLVVHMTALAGLDIDYGFLHQPHQGIQN